MHAENADVWPAGSVAMTVIAFVRKSALTEVRSAGVSPVRAPASAGEAALRRQHRRLRAVLDAELVEDLADVALDRSFAQVERARDHLVGLARGDQGQHVFFP